MGFDRKIIMDDGTEYYGSAFGRKDGTYVFEIVFNTSVVGYQEIVSDPSYTDQAVVMTYPVIGNYGIAKEDFETKRPTIGALVVRDYNDMPSNFRSVQSLSELLDEYGIPGISGVDTRMLTRSIRDFGSRRVCLCPADMPVAEGLLLIASSPVPHDAVSRVSCKKRNYSRAPHAKYSVVALDCGMKQNIVRCLNARGCDVTIVPYNTPYDEIVKLDPDGVFLSNGPGDPEDNAETIKTVAKLYGKYPMFGICLGHQLIALARGGKTYKLKFGHRGGNHPVKRLETGKIEMTSQNHSYAVLPESLEGTGLKISHINLLDNTVEGMQDLKHKVFSVQYHPESAPGPQDSSYLFDIFIKMMEDNKHA